MTKFQERRERSNSYLTQYFELAVSRFQEYYLGSDVNKRLQQLKTGRSVSAIFPDRKSGDLFRITITIEPLNKEVSNESPSHSL